jgi:GNAT superfamily N-acetyltransferase
MEIRFIPNESLHTILPLVKLLNKYADENTLQNRINEMKKTDYQCVGAYIDNQLVAICGIWTLYKHYVGKHIEADNVIVHPDFRNKQIGEKMMQWVHQFAIDQGCEASELNCYVRNSEGVKFWLNQGYKILGFHMQKIFKNENL